MDLTIRSIKEKKYYRLSVYNKKIKDDLMKLGITPDKTKNPILPNIKDDMFWHFLRGFTDGDGTIYFKNKRTSWSLVCHTNIAIELKKKIEDKTGIHVTIQDHWRTDYIRTLSINGNYNCYRFMNLLYSNSTAYLSRKYQKYKQFVTFYENMKSEAVKKKFIGIEETSSGKFSSSLKVKNKKYYLGLFDTQLDAANAYDKKIDEMKINRLKNSDIRNFNHFLES